MSPSRHFEETFSTRQDMTEEAAKSEENASGFDYDAQTVDGRRMRGTIEADDFEQAMGRLTGDMRLRVLEMKPAVERKSGGRSLRGEDFQAFNQQLAQLAAAGVPLERGLRLIAADARGRGLRRTIDDLAAELEAGVPLDRAFERYQDRFPPLYGRLIRAGMRSGNLSAVLFSLGRHVELVRRLRSVLWRAIAYPLFVLIALSVLAAFLGVYVLPEFGRIYADLRLRLPALTSGVIAAGPFAPILPIAILLFLIGLPLLPRMFRRSRVLSGVMERWTLRAPLIGRILRFNCVARWCDAVGMGVRAGLDLPGAIGLASDTLNVRGLTADGDALTEVLAAGLPLTAASTRILPAAVPAAMQFASAGNDLAGTLDSLRDLYERQAERRLDALPAMLTPPLILILATLIGLVVTAVMLPLVGLFRF